MNKDTICALATPPGGALGIIRVSGSGTFSIVSSLCSICFDDIAGNTIHYTHIVDNNGKLIDDALVSVFRAPHSYTGEDSIEISCHGSSYILNQILKLLVDDGCRMANPGEFTMRAYLNGKMDLAQAESVADLIASTNRATHQLAISQLRGGISTKLSQLREKLLNLNSLLELELDFSDHEDLEFADRTELLTLAQTIENHIRHLAHTFEAGQALKQGIPVAIVGKTNVGKSTLLNALLRDERAIVSDIHGTTRDTIEDSIEINGVTFRLVDTAGIRYTNDKVEQIGITRTYQAIKLARIVLWIVDELPTDAEMIDMNTRCKGKKLIIVGNKSDKGIAIPSFIFHIPHSMFLSISAKTGQGLSALELAIFDAADIPILSETDVIVTNVRHYDALLRAHDSILRVLDGLQAQLSGDLLAEDLRDTLTILSEITGDQITPNEVLENIFKHFCVGK